MKKFISILSVVMFIFAMSVETFAVNINADKPNIFIAEDGSEIEYYLDEYGMPYQKINGEKIGIALSLPSLEVTDEDLIYELNLEIPHNENQNMQRSAPSDFIDLSNFDSNVNSSEYSFTATGLDEDFFNTKPFKFCRSHSAVVIKSSKHKRPLFSVNDNNLNITYYYYSSQKDKWFAYTMMDKDCSVIGGFRFQHSPSIYQFGKFSFIAHSVLKSCTISIFTTPYSLAGPTIPQI